MATSIYVNLPVADLRRSTDFFTALGFSFDENFTSDNAAGMIIDDGIYAMLLVEPFFKSFTTKEVVDATKSTEAILCLGVDSKQEVDGLADKALASGGSQVSEPMDHGFMYQRSFQDPDGHIWEVMYMDPNAQQQG